MVKVWYEPPPYGPRTSLNRPAYGNGGDLGPKWVVKISKMPPGRVICGFLAAFVGIAYIPLSKLLRYCYHVGFYGRWLLAVFPSWRLVGIMQLFWN